MDIVSQIKIFTALAGTGLVGAECLSQYIKYNKNRVEELAHAKLISKKSIENLLGNDGLILAKGVQLKEKYDYEHCAVFGSTGSNKTTSIIAPNLLDNNIRGSIIVTDPKGELFELTSRYQQDVCGRKVYRFDPLSPSTSEKYNLLENCKSVEEIMRLSDTLLMNGSLALELQTGKKAGGTEWIQMASTLLTPALIYAYHQGKPFNTIDYALQLILNLDSEILGTLFMNSGISDCIDAWNSYKTVIGADNAESSIKITLTSNMRLFASSLVNKTCEDTTFNFEKFREEPSILYICYKENKAIELSPLTSSFLTQMFDILIDSFTKNSLPIHCLFDELANIGLIPGLPTIISTCRSREISFLGCLQSLSQLYQIYGRDNGKTIMNCLKTKIVLGGLSDEDTLNYISNIIGNKEINVKSTNINDKTSSETYSKTKTKLFEPSDLRTLVDEKLLIVTANKNPLECEKNIYYTQEKYTKNIGIPIKIGYDYKNNSINIKAKLKKISDEIKEEKAREAAEKRKNRNKKKDNSSKNGSSSAADGLKDMWDNVDVSAALRGQGGYKNVK